MNKKIVKIWIIFDTWTTNQMQMMCEAWLVFQWGLVGLYR